jgi:CHAT domain-containing protein
LRWWLPVVLFATGCIATGLLAETSQAQAEEIARMAAGSTLKALDFDASRDIVLKADLGEYRIVHFATHSLLNNEHQELSGVVLSLVDRSGGPQNGFLRLYDIYNLRLGSDLVVLSACQTAKRYYWAAFTLQGEWW